ncbi:ATPase, partial [Streptomyces nanshensis]
MGLNRTRSAAPAAGPAPAASAAAGTAGCPERAPDTGGPSPALLAVDAGNSKTDVALLGADGRVLGTARGGGFRPP